MTAPTCPICRTPARAESIPTRIVDVDPDGKPFTRTVINQRYVFECFCDANLSRRPQWQYHALALFITAVYWGFAIGGWWVAGGEFATFLASVAVFAAGMIEARIILDRK